METNRTISLIATSIPFVGYIENVGIYGYIGEGDLDKHDDYHGYGCWIQASSHVYELCLYGLVFLYLFVTILLLLYCIYIRRFAKRASLPNLNMRIIYFSIVFVGTWIFPSIDRLYYFSNNRHSPALRWLHGISETSMGWATALVWATSDLWLTYRKKTSLNLNTKGAPMVVHHNSLLNQPADVEDSIVSGDI